MFWSLRDHGETAEAEISKSDTSEDSARKEGVTGHTGGTQWSLEDVA